MGIKDFLKDIKHEGQVLAGEATKDTFFSSYQVYPSAEMALEAFKKSKDKLFTVDSWSDLSGLSSTFELYDASGNRKKMEQPQVGDYIRILLPGPLPENWVKVISMHSTEKEAAFTVSPSEDPHKQDKEQVEHFFTKEASSTFKVELEGNQITASEIGKNEAINNQGTQAGDRSVINTLVAEGGWAFFQKIQWQKLTDYLVHKE